MIPALEVEHVLAAPRAADARVLEMEVLPLTFLSGVFYSLHSLAPFWQCLSVLTLWLIETGYKLRH